MAVDSPIYDDQKDQQTEKPPQTKPNSQRGIGTSSNTTPTSASSEQNNFYFGGSSGALDSSQLRTAENTNKANQDSEGGNLYHPSPSSRSSGSSKNNSKSRKKLYMIGGGFIGAIIVIMILLTFVSSLFLQSFATTLLDEEFARVDRDFAQDTVQLTDEKIALDSEDPTSAGSPLEDDAALSSEFADNSGGLWSKMTSWTPSAQIKNLQTTGDLAYNYETTSVLQRQVLRSITIGDQTINLSETDPGIFSKVLHPVQTFKSQVQAAQDINAGISDSLGDTTGIIIRGSVESSIRDAAGIPLYAWVVSKFTSDTNATQASDELDQEAEQRIAPSTDPVPETDSYQIGKAVSDGDQLTQQEITNTQDIEAARNVGLSSGNSGGYLPDVNSVVNNDLSNLQSNLLSKASLVYAVAVPLCIIYDGSLQSPGAGQTIDNQDRELERSFYFVESGSDQAKAGDTTASIEGAMSTKLGNLSESNVEIRANGGTVDSLSSFMSPQASAEGQYTIANTFMPSWAATLTNDVLTNPVLGCKTLTNPAFAGATVIGQVLFQIITSLPDGGVAGVTEEGGEEAAAVAVDTAVDEGINEGIMATISSKLTSNPVTSTLLKASGKFAQRFSKSEIKKLGAISLATGGLSVVAKEITLDKMNETYDGLSQGIDFANQADAGGNLNANEVERQELFGAPLGAADLQYNDGADAQYLGSQNASKSFADRYLAVSNPDSLVTRLGMSINASLRNNFVPNLITKIGSIFNPARLFVDIASIFGNKKISAAAIEDNNDYGIVQWGYTKYEDSLINPTSGNPSYQPLENSKILFASGKDQYIEDMYGPCYSDSMGNLLTQFPPTSVDGFSTPDSQVTSHEPYIVRDGSGNVIGGLCSQKYLGPNSADPKAADPQSPGLYDLIFRWRLNNAYNNTIDQLKSIQND